VAEAAYESLLSLPIFPRMSDADVDDVIRSVGGAVSAGQVNDPGMAA
jgi:dTDP-4-amino-4,6-dideoxygalactose transaminase